MLAFGNLSGRRGSSYSDKLDITALTPMNLRVLREELKTGSGRIRHVPAVHVEHIKRAIRAGALERQADGSWVLTSAGMMIIAANDNMGGMSRTLSRKVKRGIFSYTTANKYEGKAEYWLQDGQVPVLLDDLEAGEEPERGFIVAGGLERRGGKNLVFVEHPTMAPQVIRTIEVSSATFNNLKKAVR